MIQLLDRAQRRPVALRVPRVVYAGGVVCGGRYATRTLGRYYIAALMG